MPNHLVVKMCTVDAGYYIYVPPSILSANLQIVLGQVGRIANSGEFSLRMENLNNYPTTYQDSLLQADISINSVYKTTSLM